MYSLNPLMVALRTDSIEPDLSRIKFTMVSVNRACALRNGFRFVFIVMLTYYQTNERESKLNLGITKSPLAGAVGYRPFLLTPA
jgi:hypothetical protein